MCSSFVPLAVQIVTGVTGCQSGWGCGPWSDPFDHRITGMRCSASPGDGVSRGGVRPCCPHAREWFPGQEPRISSSCATGMDVGHRSVKSSQHQRRMCHPWGYWQHRVRTITTALLLCECVLRMPVQVKRTVRPCLTPRSLFLEWLGIAGGVRRKIRPHRGTARRQPCAGSRQPACSRRLCRAPGEDFR